MTLTAAVPRALTRRERQALTEQFEIPRRDPSRPIVPWGMREALSGPEPLPLPQPWTGRRPARHAAHSRSSRWFR